MPIGQDEDIRIYELPEAQELTAGMKVAVDSETDGTKSFDLSNLAGKVDEPETAPEAGQVLTFDGTNNVWADAPEGVYVLNYSEISDIRDVDIDRARTQPTFLKIDTEQPLTISVPRSSGGPYTVNVQPGTIMGLEEIGSNGTSGTYSGPKFLIFGSKFGEEVGGGIMQNADIRVICCIALSAFGGVSKGLTVSGNMDPGGELFGSPSSPGSQPFPITTRFFVGKGPGDPNTNRTQNALGLEIQSAGKIRKQVMMPAEIQDHDFSTDATPEQIQFMGWGATSNRAGYNNLITAQHNYDSTNFPIQTPQVQFLKFKMSGGTPESDQVMNVVQATMKSADGQNTEVIGGLLVPSITYAGAVLQAWTDSNGSHYGWKPVSEVPTSTAQDEGKVLTVDSNGAAAWAASGGGTEKFIIRGLVYPSSATYIDSDKAVVDKTTTEIWAAYESGQELELQFYVINDTTITAADIDSKFAEKKDTLAPYTADLTFAYNDDSLGTIQFGFIFRSPEFYSFNNYFYDGMPSAYEYTRAYSQIRINISRYSGGDSDWISAYSEANDLGNWQIDADNWNDKTETYGNNWDYFYNTVRYYMKNHNSIGLRIDNDSVNTPRQVAYLSDYLFSTNPSYPPFFLFTHLYIPACLQGQAYRAEVRWYKFYPLEEVNPDTGETVKACKLSYGKINTQPMLPNLYVNNSSGFTISSSPWILPENNTYITPTIDSSLTELVILVSKDTIGFNAASNAQFTMRFSLSGGRTLRVRVGEQSDSGVITYFNYDADKGRDLVSPSGVYSTYFNIKVVGRSWTFEKLAADNNS